jgi:hypothetical protein
VQPEDGGEEAEVVTDAHGLAVIVVGERPPAMSVSWVKPTSPYDSGYLVLFWEFDPDDDDRTPSQVVCLHCLIEDGDEQLARGLDLAKRHGQVDFDVEADEWFVPDDAGWPEGER